MEHIFPFNYNLDFDSSNPENQIILWKIENYNSYLTDFSSNTKDKYIQFKYNLSGKDVIFTYYTQEKFFNVENLTNEYLQKQLDPIYECANLTIYELLTKIETCIENMPEETDEEDDEEEIVYPKSSSSSTQVKAGKLVTELNNKMGLTVFDTTIYDDYSEPPRKLPEIKYTPLVDDSDEVCVLAQTNPPFGEVDELKLIETSDDVFSSALSLSDSSIPDIKISEYVEKLEAEYASTNDFPVSDLSDIIIHSNKLNSDPDPEDPYSSLVLSDSDFSSFYENLGIVQSSNALDEKQILNTCLEILKSEPPITDEQMKKYAFGEISIIKMIIKEIIKASSNQKILIKPKNNNVFALDITLKKENWTNNILEGIDVELEIILPKLYYPYAPPQINIHSPKFSDIFLFSIASLDYLKQEFWNPSNTLIHTLEGLIQIINQHAELDQITNLTNYNNEIIQLWSALDLQTNVIDFKIDFTKLCSSPATNSSGKSLMASGYGYGNEHNTKWDIKKFMNEKENKTKNIVNLLVQLVQKISLDEHNHNLIQAKLHSILYYYLFDANVLEITNKLSEYIQIIKILQILKPHGFGPLFPLVEQLKLTVGEYVKISCGDIEIFELYEQINKLIDQVNPVNQSNKKQVIESYDDLKFRQFESIPINNFSSKLKLDALSSDARKRIMREFSSLKKSLPFNYETSVFFRFDEAQMNKIKFLITGPKDTPYQDGCYIFDMVLPSSYPKTCPKVEFITTGRGSVRFNPNLYACGKVCLSLLGTWSGRPEEAWNENSTMLQLFVSIQSLILIDHPYFNEPGYQSSYGSASGMASSAKYNSDVQSNNIKWAIIDSIINPDPCFVDVIHSHFANKKNEILALGTKWAETNTKVASQLDALKAALAKV